MLSLAKADQAVLKAGLQHKHNAQSSVQPHLRKSLELWDLVFTYVPHIVDGLPDETDEEGSLCLIGADQAVLRVELQHANKAQCPVQPQRLHGFSQPRRRWHIDDIPTA